MTAEAIQAISGTVGLGSAQQIANIRLPAEAAIEMAASEQLPAAAFGQLVSQGLQQVNQQLMTSQTDLQRLAIGDAKNLHQIMIGLEESRLSFQLLMQVRNRMLEAYQDVMKMQV